MKKTGNAGMTMGRWLEAVLREAYERLEKPGRFSEPVLSRDFLESGAVNDIFASDCPAIPLLTERERVASLQEMLSQRPSGPV